MELFKNANYDFLGKKVPFIIGSLVMIGAGLVSLAIKGGPLYGIDFKGGTLMYVKFTQAPQEDRIRQALGTKIQGEISVQRITGATNEVMIGTEVRGEKELEEARRTVIETLSNAFGQPGGKLDFNNAGQQALASRLREPLQKANVALSEDDLDKLAKAMLEFKNTPPRSGLITNFNQLSGVAGVTPAVIATLNQECSLSQFTIRNVEIVGPRIGEELKKQALLATLCALGGMLVYIAFRFEWIYGVAAVAAVFHDVVVTVGLFSIFDKEITLTVLAALLTLVGYSMNDTIVVFDRIRENLRLSRREKFPVLVNGSINQTLSRTILTSGLTFLTVVSLWLFGGQVLNGFSFALVVGIIVGTYSSVFIASPILVFWQNFAEGRRKATAAPAPSKEQGRRGSPKAVK